jgi:tetratricopeptide (TPR) repeat protein
MTTEAHPEYPTEQPLAEGQESEATKRLVSILIATTTIIAALSAFLQTDAGGRATQANRNAQRYAIEALGTRAAGQSQVDYGWYGAANMWYDLDTQASTLDGTEETTAAERVRVVRDKITALSPLLGKTYFDPTSGFYPNLSGYEADTFVVKATELSERYKAAAELNNIWNNKANIYIVHLTLLAVALALYGLSTAPDDWTRWVFIGAGTALVVITIGWMAITVITPVQVTSEQAIQTYAKGYGLAWRRNYKEAIVAYDDVIKLEPNYASALYERGSAHFALTEDGIGQNPKDAQAELRLTAADYESARKAGKDDGSVNWNLGWTYYLLGFFDESVTASRHALELDPNLFAVRCNLGVTLLADGKLDLARSEYADALKIVTDRVIAARSDGKEPPSSLWFYLNSCAADVDSLDRRLNDQGRFWTQAPPRELIADTPEIRAEIKRLISDIRSMSVALEYTGMVPGERPTANISAFRFSTHRKDADGNFVYDDQDRPIYDPVENGTFPNGTKKVGILYDYQGMVSGKKEIWKVYRNGREDPSLRVVSEWSLNEQGTAVKPISYTYSTVFHFSSGEYTVELYIDNYMVQSGTFIVEANQ